MPKGVYDHKHIKPRVYPPEIVADVVRMYCDMGMTVAEVQQALPRGYKAQRIIERHVPVRRKAIKRDQSGSANHMWRGDTISYDAAHERVKAGRGSAREHSCVDCGQPASDWSYNGDAEDEQIDQETGCAYSPTPAAYDARCRPCHQRFDRRRRDERGRYVGRGGDANVCNATR